MTQRSAQAVAVATVALAALLAALTLDRTAPFPSADVARGSEDAFASGLQARELPPREPPRRWTAERAVFRFHRLPAGPLTLEVALHGQRGPVAVAAGGAVVGVLAVGVTSGRFALQRGSGGSLEVELRADAFRSGDGRRLGAQLDRVAVSHVPRTGTSPGLLLLVLVPALGLLGFALAAGLAPVSAALLAVGVIALECLALWPCGLLRSSYAEALAGLLLASAGLAWWFSRWLAARTPGAGPWAFAACLAAVLVQGLAATSPLMLVSDAVFHANNLAAVAKGNYFPTSRTQHAQPFVIPYGVSFYALLVPFYRAGLEGVGLVRAGAALSGVGASLAAFWLLAPRNPARAAAAVVFLQLLPGTFDVYSYGNLSNVFGQAVTILFFAWWAGGTPGGRFAGGALIALACSAHLSSFVVLLVLAATLVVARRDEIRGDRVRVLALFIGFAAAAIYYAQFWGIVRDQLPRLLEGGGQGRGPSPGVLSALRVQGLGALAQWGLPALLLAVASLLRAERDALERDLRAYWAAGALLLLPALLSPLEVRYLYGLALPVAVAAVEGAAVLAARGLLGRLATAGLGLWQLWIAASGILEAVLHRYRPL